MALYVGFHWLDDSTIINACSMSFLSYGMERLASKTSLSSFKLWPLYTTMFWEDSLHVMEPVCFLQCKWRELDHWQDSAFKTQQVCLLLSPNSCVCPSFPEDDIMLRHGHHWVFLNIRVSLAQQTSYLSIRLAYRMSLSQGEMMASSCFGYLSSKWSNTDHKLIYWGASSGRQPYRSL